MKKAKKAEAARPHHRTTTLTVDAATFRRAAKLRSLTALEVEFVNDIVSSARGGKDVDHHAIRRVDLLRRQIAAGYRAVNVRTEMGEELPFVMVGSIKGASDKCSAKVRIAPIGGAK